MCNVTVKKKFYISVNWLLLRNLLMEKQNISCKILYIIEKYEIKIREKITPSEGWLCRCSFRVPRMFNRRLSNFTVFICFFSLWFIKI